MRVVPRLLAGIAELWNIHRRKRCKHDRSKLPLPWGGQVEPYTGYESDVRKINWDFVVILM